MSDLRKYEKFYARITSGIRKHPSGRVIINILDKFFTRIIFVIYPLLILYNFFHPLYNGEGIITGVRNTLPIILVPGVSFLILSTVRHCISRKRPYEEYDLDPLIHKEKKGRSMPSRHVFSSAVISMCALYICVPLGIVCLLITIGAAFIRVLGGVHYPSDVIVGFAVGIVSGALLFII